MSYFSKTWYIIFICLFLIGAVVLYGNWIYNYLCNQCLSPLMLWIQISIRSRCTTLCDKVCQWLVTDRWFSPGPPVSSTNKSDCHDITEILLKVAISTISLTLNPFALKIKYYTPSQGKWSILLCTPSTIWNEWIQIWLTLQRFSNVSNKRLIFFYLISLILPQHFQ